MEKITLEQDIGQRIGALKALIEDLTKVLTRTRGMLGAVIVALAEHIGTAELDKYLASYKQTTEEDEAPDLFRRYASFDG